MLLALSFFFFFKFLIQNLDFLIGFFIIFRISVSMTLGKAHKKNMRNIVRFNETKFPLKDQRAMMRRCSVRCLAPPYDDAQMLRTMLRKSSPWIINRSSLDLHCFSIPKALGHYCQIFCINEFAICNAKRNYKYYQLHSHCIMRHTTADWGAV